MARSRVKGTKQLTQTLRRLPKELRKEARKTFEREGELLRAEMARRAPKDEGDLARAIGVRVTGDGLSVSVGYSAAMFKRFWKRGGFTALFAEFGTRHHRAQPFISLAYRARKKPAIEAIRKAVNTLINKAKKYGE